jgi:hypothetical protein
MKHQQHDHELACRLYRGNVTKAEIPIATRYEESIEFLNELGELNKRISTEIEDCEKQRSKRLYEWARENINLVKSDEWYVKSLQGLMDSLQETEEVLRLGAADLAALKAKYLNREQQRMLDEDAA